MSKKRVYNITKYTKGLKGRAVYGGVYTTDLILVSFAAWIVSLLLKGQSMGVVYGVMAAVCIPLYVFLIAKNKWLPKGFFYFGLRKVIGGRQKSISMRGNKWM